MNVANLTSKLLENELMTYVYVRDTLADKIHELTMYTLLDGNTPGETCLGIEANISDIEVDPSMVTVKDMLDELMYHPSNTIVYVVDEDPKADRRVIKSITLDFDHGLLIDIV